MLVCRLANVKRVAASDMLLQGGPYKGTDSAFLQTCEGHYHLAHSRDGLDWTMHCHAQPIATFSFPLTNGSTLKVKRRERHFVLLGPDKQPLWLYNGVAGQDYIKEMGQDHTFSSAQAFSTAGRQWHEGGARGHGTTARTGVPVSSSVPSPANKPN